MGGEGGGKLYRREKRQVRDLDNIQCGSATLYIGEDDFLTTSAKSCEGHCFAHSFEQGKVNSHSDFSKILGGGSSQVDSHANFSGCLTFEQAEVTVAVQIFLISGCWILPGPALGSLWVLALMKEALSHQFPQ